MIGTKFTKGEWFIDHTGYYTRISTEDFYVCEIKRGPKANAHLIASAPNGFALGELVIKMCDHHEGLSPTEVGILYEAANEFIKKCHGE